MKRFIYAAVAAALLMTAALWPEPAPAETTLRAVLADDAEWFNAARRGDVDALGSALDIGAPLLAVNADGYSALIYAAYYGREDAVRFLLRRGADPCHEDRRGNTALMGAIFKGHLGTVRALLGAECHVDQRNLAGQTPLMFASLFGRDGVVDALVARGADVHAVDQDGNTAMSVAEGQGNFALAERLRGASDQGEERVHQPLRVDDARSAIVTQR